MVHGIFNFDREIYEMDNVIAYKLEHFVEAFAVKDFDEIDKFYETEDALTLFNIIVQLRKEYSYINLENFILEDYLRINLPVSLDTILKNIKNPPKKKKEKQSFVRSSYDTTLTKRSVGILGIRKSVVQKSFDRSLTRVSRYSTTRPADGDAELEPILNFTFRCELCENICFRLEEKSNTSEETYLKQLLNRRANVEELKIEVQEIVDTYVALVNTVTDTVGDLGSLHISSRNITPDRIKFFWDNWVKNGVSLLGVLRMKYRSLLRTIHIQQQALNVKKDLIGTLLPVDILLLQNEKIILEDISETQMDSLISMKNLSARISFAIKKQKKNVKQIQDKLDDIERNIDVTKNLLIKIHKEINDVQKEHINGDVNLDKLKEKAKNYKTPSIKDYIHRKNELHILKKEEKSLLRSLAIMQLKINAGNRKI